MIEKKNNSGNLLICALSLYSQFDKQWWLNVTPKYRQEKNGSKSLILGIIHVQKENML